MKHLITVITVSLVLFLSGCSSMFGDNNKIVHVKSVPSNTQVFANNMPVGTAPTDVTIANTWSPTLLTFKKKGYADQTTQVTTAFQPIGLLNIFFWPGFIVDAISGNMMKITPESRNIEVHMSKPV